MPRLWTTVGLLACLALLPPLSAQQEPGVDERAISIHELPGEGQEIRTCDADTFTVTSTSEIHARLELGGGLGPEAIVLTPQAGQQFVMRLRFMRDPLIGGQCVTTDEMKTAVTEAAEPYIAVSTEQAVQHKNLKYAGRPGWYACLTDKRLADVPQPPPNDYRHVVVGVIRLSDDSIVRFQLFVNDLASRDFFGPVNYALSFTKPAAATRPAATQPSKPLAGSPFAR